MAGKEKNIIIYPDKMKSEFFRILLNLGFEEGRAEKCAEIFTVNSLEGVSSHGVNRFQRFVSNIKEGYIKPGAIPSLVHRTGSLEQWNGNLGPGPLNALFATDRAMELAKENAIGMVALANTNHWMRGGTYGWHAARKGFVFIGWTNTCANMPAWGAKDPRLGNNPLVFSVPYKNEAIVLDFAMTQFSYGKMELLQKEGQQLPYPGGFNRKGELTNNPAEVLETWRALPIGYWKGASLSLLLDIIAVILSGGLSTHEISRNKVEYSLSQVYVAIDLRNLKNYPAIDNSISQIIEDLQKSVPDDETVKIRFPGERIVQTRKTNGKNGIPVNREIWENILSL
jgi:3-dehydro-L-gulonate 2-dehydrogenase